MMRVVPIVGLILFALPACKHDDGVVGTATVHSGTTEGPRVTDVRLAPPPGDMSFRLTQTICERERSCAERRGDDAAAQKSAQDCATQVEPSSSMMMQSLECDASEARPGFEACLAAIRAESCDTTGGFSTDLYACRMAQICRAGR